MAMGTYLVLEIGSSAYTEFKMKNGEFKRTEDAVLVGAIEASSTNEAIDKAKALDYCKERQFEHLIAYEVRCKS
jgi:hypothetical protein